MNQHQNCGWLDRTSTSTSNTSSRTWQLSEPSSAATNCLSMSSFSWRWRFCFVTKQSFCQLETFLDSAQFSCGCGRQLNSAQSCFHHVVLHRTKGTPTDRPQRAVVQFALLNIFRTAQLLLVRQSVLTRTTADLPNYSIIHVQWSSERGWEKWKGDWSGYSKEGKGETAVCGKPQAN